MNIRDAARALAEPIIEEKGLELVDVEFKTEGGRWVLRLYIDKEGGVNLDDCKGISYELGPLLDIKDIIHTPYSLEVSSPGLDRALKRERDFQRYAGKLVRLKTREPVNGRRNFHARLKCAADGKIVLTDNEGNDWEIEVSNIKNARLDIEI